MSIISTSKCNVQWFSSSFVWVTVNNIILWLFDAAIVHCINQISSIIHLTIKLRSLSCGSLVIVDFFKIFKRRLHIYASVRPWDWSYMSRGRGKPYAILHVLKLNQPLTSVLCLCLVFYSNLSYLFNILLSLNFLVSSCRLNDISLKNFNQLCGF